MASSFGTVLNFASAVFKFYKQINEIQNEKSKKTETQKNEINKLLNSFNEQQRMEKENNTISNLCNNCIINGEGYGFINNYKYWESEPFVLFSCKIKHVRVQRYIGPKFSKPELEGSIENGEIGKNEIVLRTLNKQYESAPTHLETYFKTFYKVLEKLNKLLERNIFSSEDYVEYISILHSQLSSEELVVILVNALYIESGIELSIELVGSSILGDIANFNRNKYFKLMQLKIDMDDLKIFDNNEENKTYREALRSKLKEIKSSGKLNQFRNFLDFR